MKNENTLFLNPESDFSDSYSDQIEILKTIQKIDEWLLNKIIDEWDLKDTKEQNQMTDFEKLIVDDSYPASSFETIKKECAFISHCVNDAETLSEQDWYIAVSVISRCKNGEALVHQISAPYPDYNESETNDKISHASETPPYTCEKIQEINGDYCEDCNHLGKVKSPILLGWSKEDQKKAIKKTLKVLSERIEQTDDFMDLTGDVAEEITNSPLPSSSILALRKRLAKKAGVSVASLEKDAKERNVHVYAKKERMHLEAAKGVIDTIGAENIIYHKSSFWKWNNSGLWKRVDDRGIKKVIHKVSESSELTKSIIDSVLDIAKTETFKFEHRFDLLTDAINCLNGELHYDEIRKEFILKPHFKEHYFTTQIPVNYDPEAEAPRFKKFLDEVFIQDEDPEIKKSLVYEIMGYSLLSTCRFEKFVLLIGPGANGKSVLMSLLLELAGHSNVSAVQPDKFDNRFQRAHLHCKLINLVTEIAQGHEMADAQLKAIVSGELTTAEHKHKPPFDFEPYATCWFGTNHMPHTRDFSDALFRRAIIIPFNRVFQEHEQDKHLKEKLMKELPGILNLILKGLESVIQRGEFVKTSETETAKRKWRFECDQVAEFADEYCAFGPGYEIKSQDLYRHYEHWADNAGIKKMLNRKNFSTRMVRLGAVLSRGSGGVRMISGCTVKAAS